MMNLQLLWWESDKTGDNRWMEIGKKHALRTAEWFVRPDGSVFQSVHYNPGDNRQSFTLHGGAKEVLLPFASNVPRESDFSHTRTKLWRDTTWVPRTRLGVVWLLDGIFGNS